MGVEIITAHGLEEYDGSVMLNSSCIYTERRRVTAADAVVVSDGEESPRIDLYQGNQREDRVGGFRDSGTPTPRMQQDRRLRRTGHHRQLQSTRGIVTPGNWAPTWSRVTLSVRISCLIQTEIEIKFKSILLGANNVRATQETKILCEW